MTTHNLFTLPDWLAYIEQLHPKAIDMGLERVKTMAQRMDIRFDCPVITVAGTNGKGSTCAMLESTLQQAGYRCGVFTSPHLVRFEERLRLQGAEIAAGELMEAFARVEQARGTMSLSYFEFTTLAILDLMVRAQLEVAILEVGLGGRLDAVNVIDADCAVITSIDLDHMEFLGPDRESIGREKAGIMRAARPVVVSDPMPPQSVLDYAVEIGADLWRLGRDFNVEGDKQQWGWVGRAGAGPSQSRTAPSAGSAACEAASVGAKDTRRYSGLAYPALRGANQLINAAGVLAALTALRERLPVTAQAIRNGLAFVELPGRFQIVPGQPSLVLDVAHNPHSVAALAANLDAMGYFPSTHAVFGAMADKDMKPMLERISPLIEHWYFTDLPTPRAEKALQLERIWRDQNPQSKSSTQTFTDAMQALRAAVRAADPADRIVVFGSFYTVGGILKEGVPRLQAQHINP